MAFNIKHLGDRPFAFLFSSFEAQQQVSSFATCKMPRKGNRKENCITLTLTLTRTPGTGTYAPIINKSETCAVFASASDAFTECLYSSKTEKQQNSIDGRIPTRPIALSKMTVAHSDCHTVSILNDSAANAQLIVGQPTYENGAGRNSLLYYFNQMHQIY